MSMKELNEMKWNYKSLVSSLLFVSFEICIKSDVKEAMVT